MIFRHSAKNKSVESSLISIMVILKGTSYCQLSNTGYNSSGKSSSTSSFCDWFIKSKNILKNADSL